MKFNDVNETFYPTPRLVSLVREYSNGRILDVGCGTGVYFKYFKGKEIYGTDLNASYLRSINKSKYPGKKIYLKKADIRKLPFQDNYFDFIICSLVLEYMKTKKDLNKAVSELKRVLKKNGTLIITTPHKNLFTIFIRNQIFPRILSKERKDPNFIMGVTHEQKDLQVFGFETRGCLGWVTYKTLNNKILSKILDQIFWRIPFFSGTLIGIYSK